jgi:L-ornithine N5-oxygenase
MNSSEHSDASLEHEAKATSPMSTEMYDLVCIGFGPAQVAIAIANREAKKQSRVLFIERKPSFSWHSGAHTSRTRMDNPFVYDLATIRNPRSAFSYVNYLLASKRLIDFANSDRLNPLRVEFEDYLRWCAEQFKGEVRYGSEAIKVVPESDSITVRSWSIGVRDGNGSVSFVQARSIVVPSPSSDSVPKPKTMANIDFHAGQRIISMDDYQSKRNDLRGANKPRLNVAVVGSGRQTAEILDDLLSCPRLGNITVVTEDESLTPLRVLGEQESLQPRLCSIWAKPLYHQDGLVTEASELVQTIYMRAYEKQVASRGQYTLRVVVGKDAADCCTDSNIIIRDTATTPLPNTELLQCLDALVLGCRVKGDSLEEVQFKRGAVATGNNVFLMSAHSEGGRSLAKDIAVAAGHVVKALSPTSPARPDGTTIQARM